MILKFYLRFLSLAYLFGFLLHLADILDLRLTFSTMDKTWQAWIIYLAIVDLVAAIGLWRQKSWGIYVFFIVASSQLIAYLGFVEKFGRQDFLVVFHLTTLSAYVLFRWINTKLIKSF